MNGTYNAFSYNARATQIIHDHDASTPLFMYLAWQVCDPHFDADEVLNECLLSDAGTIG